MVIEKVALVLPAGIVTLTGTLATEELLLDNATITPPLGAGPLKRAVPVELLPPTTVVGLRETDDKAGGATLKTADFATPP